MSTRQSLRVVLVLSVLILVIPIAYGEPEGNELLLSTLNVTVVTSDGSPLTALCRIVRDNETIVEEKVAGEKSFRLVPGTYRVTFSALDREITQQIVLPEGSARGMLFTFPLFRVELSAVSRRGKSQAARYIIQRRDDRVALTSGKIAKKDQPAVLHLEAGTYVVVISRGDERFEEHIETGSRTIRRVTARFGQGVLFLKALIGDQGISAYFEVFSSTGIKVKAGSIYSEGVRVVVEPGKYTLKAYREVRSGVIIERDITLKAGKETLEEINFLGTLKLTATGIDGRSRWAWYELHDKDGNTVSEGIIPRDGYEVPLDPGDYTVCVSPAAYNKLGVEHEVSVKPGEVVSRASDLEGAIKIRFYNRERNSREGYYRIYSKSDEKTVLDEGVISTGEVLLPAAPGDYKIELAPKARARRKIEKTVSVSGGNIAEIDVVYP
ncbi:MAG: hypothetical protein QGH40_06285 [bacterium]|jgi:hypothetical protein|nr:hypothetical protein [bacterium]